MAKKAVRKKRTTKTAAPVTGAAQMAAPASPGKGKKACPECKSIVSAASRECPNCHHKFQKKAKGAKRGPKAKRGSEHGNGHAPQPFAYKVGNGKAAQAFIEASGGLDNAIGILMLVKSVVGDKVPF